MEHIYQRWTYCWTFPARWAAAWRAFRAAAGAFGGYMADELPADLLDEVPLKYGLDIEDPVGFRRRILTALGEAAERALDRVTDGLPAPIGMQVDVEPGGLVITSGGGRTFVRLLVAGRTPVILFGCWDSTVALDAVQSALTRQDSASESGEGRWPDWEERGYIDTDKFRGDPDALTQGD